MAVDQTFAAAYIDNGNVHKVLGVKLRPFCAWHLFLLQVVESPFLDAGNVYLPHLRRAVGICRMGFPRSRTKLPFWPLILKQKRLEQEVGKFLAYFGDYMHRPDYSIIPVNDMPQRGPIAPPRKKPTSAPDVIHLVFDAAHGANISVNEAWNIPIGQAYIAQAMHMRNQGVTVDFMDEGEREYQRQLKELLAKRGNGSHAST